MAPKKFPPRKTATKGKRPPGVPAQYQRLPQEEGFVGDEGQELGISLKHLQNWWKNVKDWYVKLSKRTSGQATKMLTERDKWVSMPTDVPDTLVNLPRDPSSDAQTSQAQYPHDSGEANILEDMEVAAAAEQASTRRKRKTPATERQEEEWMVDLRSTMKANQALLERLLEERSQPPVT
ncbi:hypothetical protein GWK47_048787 [Chionoecetes opilio]|uniref:Uncharacterized protein n=1 Tax=Chionoecetes opilio TaxID=41210 RepID=A0A8J4YAR3_CHIOP|nr:hypothetical protein GWK47_048787 [Chionoecetes opilio]